MDVKEGLFANEGIADEYRQYLNKKHHDQPNINKHCEKFMEVGTNTDANITRQIENVNDRHSHDYSKSIRNLAEINNRWELNREFNESCGRSKESGNVNAINTGLCPNDITICRGLTDDECERIADYVALHNAFEAMDIASVRALKADVIRYSKMLSRDNTKLYDFLRIPDLFVILEITINKRLTHELAFSTMFATNITLQGNVEALHQVSNGKLVDARMSVFKQLQSAIYDNLYHVMSGSAHLPSN